jgi:ABC-type branched-subunit amino acid transport system substrate-binding protein
VTHAIAILLLVIATACGGPKTRKTLVPDVPSTGDATARSQFIDARSKFLKDGKNGEDFQRIAEEFPEDPIKPWAQLYAGIAAVNDRKFETAVASLSQVLEADVPEGLAKRASLFLGIAKNYQGDAKAALPLLKRGASAVENDQDRTEYLAALAYATSTVDPLASFAIFDQLYPRVTPTEKTLIVTRCEEVAANASSAELKRFLDDLDSKGPALAAVASRLAIAADQSGNSGEAQRMRELAGPARQAVGLPKTIRASVASGGGGKSGLVGAVLPSGKNKAGEAATAGLGLAAGATDAGGVVAVELRAVSDTGGAVAAVEELAKHDVVAIVGPIDGASVDAAGGRAEGLGVPLLSLASRPEERTTGRFVFHMRHSAEARARSLAKKVMSAGVKSFAILAPDDKYGASVTAAFVDEVTRGGGTITSKTIYPPATKSFVGLAGKVTGNFEALFVPDEADKLTLIAPAISASGKVPKPLGTKRAAGGRPIVLLSTAEGLTGSFIANADRHADGAILAPGYYPDDKDPAQKTFLDRFLVAFGRAPGANEAYAYDAAQLAAAAGSGGRAGLAAMLATGSLAGLTGTIKFDADHRRADPGVLYTVVDESGTFAIRAIK